jgi:hypothetical protein
MQDRKEKLTTLINIYEKQFQLNTLKNNFLTWFDLIVNYFYLNQLKAHVLGE